MKVLGYHISDKGTANSDKEVPNNLSLVEYLLLPKVDTIRIFYDLEYSVNFIQQSLKLTTKEIGVLRDTTKFHLPPYHLRYVVGKFLSIKRSSAFSYFSNASQYAKDSGTGLVLNPFAYADRARIVGEQVRDIFSELGIEAVSLTSPARAYEKSQVAYLYKEMQKFADNCVRKSIIDSIGLEVFGRSWETYLQEKGNLNGSYNE